VVSQNMIKKKKRERKLGHMHAWEAYLNYSK